MDNVWVIALYTWASIGIVVLLVYFLWRAGKPEWWKHALGATGIFFAGIFYLGAGYSVIASFYDKIKATATIANADLLGSNERTLLYLYYYAKYSWKILSTTIIMSLFGLLSIYKMWRNYFIMLITISIIGIVSEVGLNLNFLIINESYIFVTILSLYVLLIMCIKFFEKSDNNDKKLFLKNIIASVLVFIISIVANAWIWKYLDPWFYSKIIS